MRIAVVGGTGLAGRHVVAELTARGHRTVVVARSRGADLVTGQGLDEALASVETVVDVANVEATGRKAAEAFFATAGRHLLAAEQRAGVRHHVALSVIGVDRVGLGYYRGKLRQEQLIEAGPVPWTVLRAAQFHDFADQALALVPGPVALVPRMRSQPVAVEEVAALLADLAVGQPQGRVPEIAGPREES
ncbi:Uncharacterized conserved protein YbjT, contains NAD(P)-binding and DUF2867 domains, partial [Streptomyces sp. DvalAA-14]|uniref:SDR family oxidoreductase n=1 Tax=unclassified Streptomyces TaxID=2593676 RepID=UPI00081B99DD